jgi:hypothetical protein
MSNATPAPGVHLDDDGTARLVFAERVIHLRAATLGEYTDIVDVSRKIDEDVAATRVALREIHARLIANEAADGDREEAERISKYVDSARREVINHIVGTLSDDDLIDFDNPGIPMWLAGPSAVVRVVGNLMNHWENVPFHGSGRNES